MPSHEGRPLCYGTGTECQLVCTQIFIVLQAPVTFLVQAACDFVGYTARRWVLAVYALLVVSTGGLAWVVMQCLPQRPLWSMRQCPLNKAEHILVKVGYAKSAGSAGMYGSTAPLKT